MPAPHAGDPLRTTDHEAARPPAAPPTGELETLPPAPPTGDIKTVPPAPAVDSYATLPPAGGQGSSGSPGLMPGYEILGKLGEGGMGVVYKARHVQLGRLVALKMILSGVHARQGERARFHTEAEAIARLQHPNIVQIYEVGEQEGKPFFSLEFCPGGGLDQSLNGTPLPPPDAARLVEALARAMHAAHQKGVIHRDLKPANVLLAEDGTPKITDFGLAKKLDDVGQTASGAIMGTPSYMAPEQAGGKSKDIGPAVDVYALGAILYELLTGRPPFKAATALDTIMQVVAEEPVAPAQLQPKVPPDLETICLKCLQKEPPKRYASAGELAEDLRRFRAGEPIRARAVGRLERGWRWCRRNPVVASLLATVALLAAAGGAAVTWKWREAEGAWREAAARGEAEKQARQAGEVILTDMYTSLGLAAGTRNDPRQAVLWFANAARLARDDAARVEDNRIRAHAWERLCPRPLAAFFHAGDWLQGLAFHPSGRYLLTHGLTHKTKLWDLDREAAMSYPDSAAEVSAATWDDPGERLALATRGGKVAVLRFPTWQLVQQVPYAGPVSKLLFSADGNYLVLVANNTARVWDCRQATFVTPDLGHPAAITTLAIHPQGRQLTTTCQDSSCWSFAIPADNDRPLFRISRHIQEIDINLRTLGMKPVPPAYVDEGRGLLTAWEGVVSWCDTATGKVIRTLRLGDPGQVVKLEVLRASPDGNFIVLAGKVGSLSRARFWKVATGEPIGSFMEHRPYQYILASAFSPDGKVLATAGGDHTVRLWTVPDGKPQGGPLTYPTSPDAVAFSGDGRRLVITAQGGLIRVLELPSADLYEHRLPLNAPSFARLSRDSRYVLPSGLDHRDSALRSVQVYDLATGQAAGPPLSAGGILLDADFSPDGRQVALAASVAASPADRSNRPGSQRGRLTLWDWREGRQVAQPLNLFSEPRKLDYSPDGRYLALLQARGQVVLVDPASWKVVRQWQAHAFHPRNNHYLNNGSLRLTPDGQSVFTFGTESKVVCGWDVASGARQFTYNHGAICRDVQFSPDGRLGVTASYDNTVHVWDRATGRGLITLAHPDWVFTAAFNGDGTRLLTACRDGMARLWDWQAGRLACPAFEHEHEVRAVAFTPDGRRILTTSDDKTLRLWEGTTGKPLSPPLPLRGQGITLSITPDGSRVVVGGFLGELPILHLTDWLAPGTLTPDELCTWGEVLSGQRVHEGGGVTNLTAEEWLDRWRSFRKLRPGRGKAASPGP